MNGHAKKRQLPKRLSQKTAVALLVRHGWARTVGGKHNVKTEKRGRRPITLPDHKAQTYGSQLSNAITA